MYKFIFENKLIYLSVASAIIFYILLKNTEPVEHKNIRVPETSSSKVSSKILDTQVITEQLNDSIEKDTKNVLIDNDILNGKIELPKVEYTDPSIGNLVAIDEKNQESLDKYTKGSVVFNQTILTHTSNKECCIPGSYTQCTNNVYNKKC